MVVVVWMETGGFALANARITCQPYAAESAARYHKALSAKSLHIFGMYCKKSDGYDIYAVRPCGPDH